MKASRLHSSNRAAFTLIELLVVISILGILMGMAVGGTGAIKNQARTAQARNDCTGLVVAMKAFYNDYSRYPIPASKVDDVPYEPSKSPEGNKEVIDIITAKDQTINPRGITYFEGKNAGVSSSGGPVSGISKEGGMFDPWGWTYGIVVDGDYDGKLVYAGASLNTLKDEPSKTISGGVGVFSLGIPNKKPMVPILTWQ